MNYDNLVDFFSLVLPFSNEIAIILTESRIPMFRDLYSSCFNETILGDIKVPKELERKICKKNDYRNKIIIDLIAYCGIILLIGKNTLQSGFVTGVSTGLVIIFCSILLPNLFLEYTIHKTIHLLKYKKDSNGILLVGFFYVFLLIGFTNILLYLTRLLTKDIKFSPVSSN